MAPLPGRPSRPRSARRYQRGAMTLVLFGLFGLAAATVVVYSLHADSLRSEQQRRTDQALALARQALIGYALKDDNLPGGLPCPDTDNDGVAQGSCGPGGTTSLGRLPWRTLGLPDLRDGSGERLWYALAPRFRNNPTYADAINADAAGGLRIESWVGGSAYSSSADLAAILFAPGAPVAAQIRDPATTGVADRYLEGPNAIAGSVFRSEASSASFNDRLLGIASAELIRAVELRLHAEVTRALEAFYQAFLWLPAPADFANTGATGCLGTAALEPDPTTTPTRCLPAAGVFAGRLPANLYAQSYANQTPEQRVRTSAWSASVLSGRAGTPNWFQREGWREQVVYLVDPDCVAGNCASGGEVAGVTPFGVPINGQRFVVLLSGPPGAGQVRATPTDKANIANYLEGPALAAFHAHAQ
jgi:type II secretory pathway pseudopilin PulG